MSEDDAVVVDGNASSFMNKRQMPVAPRQGGGKSSETDDQSGVDSQIEPPDDCNILPPSIEFVLSSPALGILNLHAVDPPWLPHAKTRGSISQLLDFDEQADITDTNKIQLVALFRLLIALEYSHSDALRDECSILELVKDDKQTTTVTGGIQALSVAYAPDSIRSLQMLGIIDLLSPRYLEYLKYRTTTNS
ncbi:unnamed protein product [Didymodactylos carnosus]|uniref:Uncharacterized protein n=1 Tax=Didymodactylos carnosus TaxID=1234261 RepID=A0A815VU67_9BILA|nr:unnamed protein product [Didymodactylos carnosus]CAF4397306.1 unnamed protein product [Didymodactylos carnosus]